MIHGEIDRLDGGAAMSCSGGDQHDAFTRLEITDTVPHEQAIECKPVERAGCQCLHSRLRQRFVVLKFERLNAATRSNLANKARDTACLIVRGAERPKSLAEAQALRKDTDIRGAGAREPSHR